MRVLLWCLGVILALSACSTPNSPSQGAGTEAFGFLKSQLSARMVTDRPVANTAVTVTRSMLKGIDDPLIRSVAERTNAHSLLYIAQINGASQVWFAPDKVSLTMQDGVITQSRGLGADLSSADAAQMIAVTRGAPPGPAMRTHRELDATNHIVVTHYDCVVSRMGAKTIQILGTPFQTTLYEERCASGADAFVNQYWIDSKRMVRASRQRISRDFGFVRTERLID